jgi:hypothetical protein
MSLRDKNSTLGPKKISASNSNQKNTIETKFETSDYYNLKYNKYDPTSTRSLAGFLFSSTPTPNPPTPIGAFSSAFSNAFNI